MTPSDGGGSQFLGQKPKHLVSIQQGKRANRPGPGSPFPLRERFLERRKDWRFRTPAVGNAGLHGGRFDNRRNPNNRARPGGFVHQPEELQGNREIQFRDSGYHQNNVDVVGCFRQQPSQVLDPREGTRVHSNGHLPNALRRAAGSANLSTDDHFRSNGGRGVGFDTSG